MKKVRYTAMVLAASLLSASAYGQQAQSRLLPDIAVSAQAARGATATNTRLSALKPDGRWVLLVLDSGLQGSERYLNSLKADGFNGEQLLVVFIGNRLSAEAMQDRNTLPTGTRWASGTFNDVMGGLKLSGTPAFFGIDRDGQVRWQRLGYGQRPGDMLVRIWDWVRVVNSADN